MIQPDTVIYFGCKMTANDEWLCKVDLSIIYCHGYLVFTVLCFHLIKEGNISSHSCPSPVACYSKIESHTNSKLV